MGTRFKVFESTGLAPNGRLYAGDLNQIQDSYADQSNLSQEIGVAALTVGESSLKMIRYGPAEGRITGALRTDGIFRGLGGLYAGAFTTAQRDAIAAGLRPYGLIILNTTNNRYEWNANTDAAPNWQPISPPLNPGSITGSLLAANSVDSSKLVDGSVTYADLEAALKPSVAAPAGTEALRAIGGGAGQVVAGNDGRLSDQRTPLDNSVTNAKIVAGAGIPYSKLALGNSIGNADVAPAAGIVYSKLNLAGSVKTTDLNFDVATQTELDAEATARASQDGTLQTNINNEANARSGQDTTLQNNINAEATTRANADTNEQNARVNADSNLQTQITNHQTWINAQYQIRGASQVVNPNENGDVSVPYGQAFPNGTISIVATGGDPGAGEFMINIVGFYNWGFNAHAAQWVGWFQNASGPLRINYIAIGY